MSRCVIISACPVSPELAEALRPDDFIIACDAGYRNCAPLGRRPNIIVGDFDTAPCPEQQDDDIIVLPHVKDDTDTEYAAKLVSGIAAVCSPLDLVGSSYVIRKGFSRIYDLNFISTMKKKALAKAKRFPGVLDVEKIKKIRWLWQFDDLFTAPIFGYKDYMDYWTKCSSKPHLGGIRLPTLVLNAKNDPIVGNEVLPMIQEVSKFVTLEYPAEGGHCGFPRKPNEGSLGFLPTRTFDFCFRGR